MAGVNGIEIKVGQVWRMRNGNLTAPLYAIPNSAYPFGDATMGATWTDTGVRYLEDDSMADTDLIELVKDENGFTIWRGGEQPEETRGTWVALRYEDGDEEDTLADAVQWGNPAVVIAAYKVVEHATQADSATLAEETLSALGWTFDGQAWTEQPRIELVAPTPTMREPGYELLAYVLERAYNQAALGKGKERHANGEPFDEQVMQDGARRFGVGALLFQAFKKSEESQRLPLDRGVNELLGAIVYLAGAVIRREADAQEGVA